MITLNTYVKRLEKFLNNPNIIHCNVCPGMKRFTWGNPILESWSELGYRVDHRICYMCQEFVGIDSVLIHQCPCMKYGTTIAKRKARAAIRKFKKSNVKKKD